MDESDYRLRNDIVRKRDHCDEYVECEQPCNLKNMILKRHPAPNHTSHDGFGKTETDCRRARILGERD